MNFLWYSFAINASLCSENASRIRTFDLISSSSYSDENGALPYTISYRITPTDHQSHSCVWPPKELINAIIMHKLWTYNRTSPQDDLRSHVACRAHKRMRLIALLPVSSLQNLYFTLYLFFSVTNASFKLGNFLTLTFPLSADPFTSALIVNESSLRWPGRSSFSSP